MEKKEKTVEERVIDVICDEMGCESANLDDRLQSDLSMDSLDIAEVIHRLGNIYCINLEPDSSLHYNVMTVGDLVNMVKEAQNQSI